MYAFVQNQIFCQNNFFVSPTIWGQMSLNFTFAKCGPRESWSIVITHCETVITEGLLGLGGDMNSQHAV